MSMTRILVTVLSLSVASLGGAACSCNGQKNNLRNPDGSDPLAQRLTITVVGNSNVVLAQNRDVVLTFLVSYGNDGVAGTGIGGVRVDFSKSGLSDLFIGSDYATTETDGTVTVRVRAGSTNGQGKVTAATEGATPVDVTLDVNSKYAGNFVVRAGYNGPVKIARLDVRLHDGRSTCQANWKATAPNGLPASVQTLTIPNVSTDARFNNLTDKTKYIATVVAFNAVNRPVAYGCGGPEEVAAQRDKILNVQLETMEPSVIGKYEFGQTLQPLDFMDQNSTTWVVLDNIFRFLSDPVMFLLDGVQTTPGSYYGICAFFTDPQLKQTCKGLGHSVLQPLIYQLLGLDDSGTAPKIYNAITQIATQVKNIRVGGVLDIKTFDASTGKVTAEMKFDKYNLIWTWECPDYNPSNVQDCCGHRVFDGSTLGIQPFSAIVKTPNGDSTIFNGQLTKVSGTSELAYDVSFDETHLSLVYGSVVLALVEGVLLPALLTDPVRYPRDPQGRVKLGTLLAGALSCTTGTQTAAQIACSALTGTLSTIVTQLANSLSFSGTDDWNLKQHITAGRLTDGDADLQPEALEADFTFSATGAAATAVQKISKLRANFTTTECTGDASCGAGLACRFARSPVDSCMPSNYCGVPSGPKAVYEACQIDDECSSGTCMTTPPPGVSVAHVNKCFKACEADSDCGGQGHCDVGGYVSQPPLQVGDTYMNRNTYAGTCVP